MSLPRLTSAFEPVTGELYTGPGAVPFVNAQFGVAALTDEGRASLSANPFTDFSTDHARVFTQGTGTTIDYNTELHDTAIGGRRSSDARQILAAVQALDADYGDSPIITDCAWDRKHGRRGRGHRHCEDDERGHGRHRGTHKHADGQVYEDHATQVDAADARRAGASTGHGHDHGHDHDHDHADHNDVTVAADGTLSQTNGAPAAPVAADPAAPAAAGDHAAPATVEPAADPASVDPAVIAATTYRPSGVGLG